MDGLSFRYWDDFLKLSCAPDLLKLKLFPDSKEVTEAMYAFDVITKHLGANLRSDYANNDYVIVVGDGSTPRCAAMLAYRMAGWNCVSIDPQLFIDDENKRHPVKEWKKIRGLTLMRNFIENVHIRCRKAIVVMTHCHVSVDQAMKSIHAEEIVGVITVPCCNWYEIQMTFGGKPADMTYNDKAILSKHNEVRVWVKPKGLVAGQKLAKRKIDFIDTFKKFSRAKSDPSIKKSNKLRDENIIGDMIAPKYDELTSSILENGNIPTSQLLVILGHNVERDFEWISGSLKEFQIVYITGSLNFHDSITVPSNIKNVIRFDAEHGIETLEELRESLLPLVEGSDVSIIDIGFISVLLSENTDTLRKLLCREFCTLVDDITLSNTNIRSNVVPYISTSSLSLQRSKFYGRRYDVEILDNASVLQKKNQANMQLNSLPFIFVCHVRKDKLAEKTKSPFESSEFSEDDRLVLKTLQEKAGKIEYKDCLVWKDCNIFPENCELDKSLIHIVGHITRVRSYGKNLCFCEVKLDCQPEKKKHVFDYGAFELRGMDPEKKPLSDGTTLQVVFTDVVMGFNANRFKQSLRLGMHIEAIGQAYLAEKRGPSFKAVEVALLSSFE